MYIIILDDSSKHKTLCNSNANNPRRRTCSCKDTKKIELHQFRTGHTSKNSRRQQHTLGIAGGVCEIKRANTTSYVNTASYVNKAPNASTAPDAKTTPNVVIFTNIMNVQAGSFLRTINEEEISELYTGAGKTSKSPKVNCSRCITFIKREMDRNFTSGELANSNKDQIKIVKELSPRRLQNIYVRARRNYSKEFEGIQNINEVVNSKCRKATIKFNK